MLKEGTKAPDFTLENSEKKHVSLSDFSGNKVILYFYPKDDTPGCTKEACSFRDSYQRIVDKGAVIIGVSADTPESHARFKEKYHLPFILLSDPEKATIQGYQAWGEKNRFGKTVEGILRSTYLIDEDGVIRKTFPNVSPDAHAGEVAEFL